MGDIDHAGYVTKLQAALTADEHNIVSSILEESPEAFLQVNEVHGLLVEADGPVAPHRDDDIVGRGQWLPGQRLLRYRRSQAPGRERRDDLLVWRKSRQEQSACVAQPSQQLRVNLLGRCELDSEVPAVLGDLLRFCDSGIGDRVRRLDGEEQMLFAGVYAGEGRGANQVNRRFLQLFVEWPERTHRGQQVLVALPRGRAGSRERVVWLGIVISPP